MKQERIEELLQGTEYEAIANPSARPMPENWQHALDALHDDAALNAARVQLLAKALREAQELIVASGKPLGDGYVCLKKPLAEANKLIDVTLKEAGIDIDK